MSQLLCYIFVIVNTFVGDFFSKLLFLHECYGFVTRSVLMYTLYYISIIIFFLNSIISVILFS